MVSYVYALCYAELINSNSAGCGMWYQRIAEYNDVDPPPAVHQTP